MTGNYMTGMGIRTTREMEKTFAGRNRRIVEPVLACSVAPPFSAAPSRLGEKIWRAEAGLYTSCVLLRDGSSRDTQVSLSVLNRPYFFDPPIAAKGGLR